MTSTVPAKRKLSPAELKQRRDAPVTHGGYSEAHIRPAARAQTRAFLRRTGLKAGDLDGVQRGYLDAWARCQSKVVAIDTHLGEVGLIRADGELQPSMKAYVSLVNSARLSLAKLEDSLRGRERDQGGVQEFLDGYAEEADAA